MIKFLKHMFHEHGHSVLAVLILILLITAVPDMEIQNTASLDSRKVARLLSIGKLSFLGAGDDTIHLSGLYRGPDKKTLEVALNTDGRTFDLIENGKKKKTFLMTSTSQEIAYGIKVAFDLEAEYIPGSTWVISTGLPANINKTKAVAVEAGRSIAAIFDRAQNTALALLGRTTQIAPETVLAVGGRRDGQALFDIEIAPGSDGRKKGVSVPLVIASLLLITGLIYWLAHKKRQAKHVDDQAIS